jgi:hypothetical protein
MPEYILHQKPGHAIEEAVGNPDFDNAEILVYAGGVLERVLPVNYDTLNRLRPVPPPSYMQREKVMGEYVLDKPIAPNHFIVGINPHVQAIYSTVREAGTSTLEDIYKSLAKDYRILPDNSLGMAIVKDLIDGMNRDGFLVKIKKRSGVVLYGPGLAPRGKHHLVDFLPGFDPIEYQIVWYVEVKGMASRADIHEYILHRLEWLKSPSELDWYINRLAPKGAGFVTRALNKVLGTRTAVPEGNLERLEGERFTFRKPLLAFA